MHRSIVTVGVMMTAGLRVSVYADTVQGPCESTVLALPNPDPDYWDRFGQSVSLSGDRAAATGVSDLVPGQRRGVVHVFKREGATWIQNAMLSAPDADRSLYGAVIEGDRIAVRASGRRGFSDPSRPVYVFKREGTEWVVEGELSIPDIGAEEGFGSALSVSSNWIVVGALEDGEYPVRPGSAYVFRREGTTWFEDARLTASDGAHGDRFGRSASISEDWIVIGAHAADCASGSNCGSAYVFVHQSGQWVESAKLTASDASANARFGFSAAITGDTAVVGAFADDSGAGSAYVFRQVGTNWTEVAKLRRTGAGTSIEFGYSVAIDGDRILVGAHGSGIGTRSTGRAHLFQRDGGIWFESAEFGRSDLVQFALFGRSVALDGDSILVGCPECGRPNYSGAIYVYAVEGPDCNVNGEIDVCDVWEGRSDDTDGNGIPDECEPTVYLDIKPGSCPNPLNPRSRGVLPVAIVGDGSFDVMQIDVDSLALARADGVGGFVTPLSGPPGPGIHIEDVATPFDGAPCDCNEASGDGIDDLTFKFSTAELVDALDLSSVRQGDELTLTLHGLLLDGTGFEASDCVVIVGRQESSHLSGRRRSK